MPSTLPHDTSLPAGTESEPDNSAFSVLIVDSEELLTKSCAHILALEGYTVFTAASGREGMGAVRRHRPDIVLLERRLPDADGLAMLGEIRALAPETMVVVITGFAAVDDSVRTLEAGAYDYVPKPFTATQLRILVGSAARQHRLQRDVTCRRERLAELYGLETVIGTSAAMQRVREVVSRVAPTDDSVLISGEPGTGREHVARAVQAAGPRVERPFVVVDCAAPRVPFALQAELFGYERNGFGTHETVRGLLEVAFGGTVLLDEITEIDTEVQAGLLRAVRERRVWRVAGGDFGTPIDVRWICTTRRDPEQAVREGTLHPDLFRRLATVHIRLPPLRERREDIPALARHFLGLHEREHARRPRFSDDALRVLGEHPWPGNVRELKDAVERIVSRTRPGEEITPAHLPELA
jgi:DNA-binding NtrC family response regulator